MKKLLMGFVLVAVVATGVFAAGAQDKVTIEGKLVITDSIPTIVANGKTWIVPAGPFYQVAYENNIKVGDTIKAEGFERKCPEEIAIKDAKMLMPTKVSVNGKELNLTTIKMHPMMGERGDKGGRGGMRGEGRRGCCDGDDFGSGKN